MVNISDSISAAKNLWEFSQLHETDLDQVSLEGSEPILPSVYKTGVAAQSSIAVAALAASKIWEYRTGETQKVSVAMKHAAIAFRSERYLNYETSRYGSPAHSGKRNHTDSIHGFYICGDGGWIQIHANYPAHRLGALKALDCEDSAAGVQKVLMNMMADDVENYLTDKGLPVGMMRTIKEWNKHPQGRAVAQLPLMEIKKIGDSEKLNFTRDPNRPLEGIKVLELSKVLAGPLMGRTLAEHGAEILWLNDPHLDVIDGLVIDMSRGKRPAYLDLNDENDKNNFINLSRTADVFVQGYRPGSIRAKGFSPEDMADIRPGIVCVELSAFGHMGPWSNRRGFDSIIQTVSGIGREGGRAAGEEGMIHMPCQALDHATGYLGAFGAMIALLRQRSEGGSWLVRVSLAQTGQWLKSLGRLDQVDAKDIPDTEVNDYLQKTVSPYGSVSFTKPAAQLSKTPAYWSLPPSPFGTFEPSWK